MKAFSSSSQLGRKLDRVSHLLIGLGNHAYPLSRESVGLYALNRFAERNEISWDFVPSICCDTITSTKGLMLVKPKTYLQQHMGKAALWATEAMTVPIRDVTILHYDTAIPVGEGEITRGPLRSRNEAVESIIQYFNTEDLFRRAAIGVGYRSEQHRLQSTAVNLFRSDSIDEMQEQLFLLNIFSADDRKLVDRVSDELVEELLKSSAGSATTFSRLNTL